MARYQLNVSPLANFALEALQQYELDHADNVGSDGVTTVHDYEISRAPSGKKKQRPCR